jgi:hypothetical protein
LITWSITLNEVDNNPESRQSGLIGP